MLVDRCLVVVDPHYDYLQMHNHLRDLGRSIEKMQRPRQRFRETADLQKKCPTQVRHSERSIDPAKTVHLCKYLGVSE